MIEVAEEAFDSVSESSGSSSQRDVPSLLSDAGTYSYAALISLSLHELFDNPWDRKFNEQCISVLLRHLNLPDQVMPVMISLLQGEGSQSPDAYIDLLLSEPSLSGRAVLVIEDLLYLAVRGVPELHKVVELGTSVAPLIFNSVRGHYSKCYWKNIDNGEYDSRMRVLIRKIAEYLKVPIEILELYEVSVVRFLTEEIKELSEEEKKEVTKRQRKKKMKRYALIGLATLGGGAVLGLTGGLAAPLIGAGVGTILGAGSAAVLGSTAGIAIIGSLFGVAGAGLTGFKMRKRVGEVEEFQFGVLTGDPTLHTELHITIAVSGWISDELKDNFTRPWKRLLHSREQYFLRYESQYLLELGRAMDYILSFAVSMAAQEALKYTILNGIISAIAWPASLVTLASVIDNPWGVCCRRSAEVGKQLAQVLISREQGQRPVTLVGFSLGARVLYYCLREMSERDGCEGIVQDVVMLGTPVTGSAKEWKKLERVVAGRIINGYCKGDWLLKFMYRTFSMASGVAGLQEINCPGRKLINVNLTEVVSGHSDYSNKIGEILKLVGIRTIEEVPLQFEGLMKKSASGLPRSKSVEKISLTDLRPSRSDQCISTKPLSDT